MTERIKKYFRENADKPVTMFWFNLLAFAESSFFPIPPDPFQAILTLAKPNRWVLFARNVLIYSVLGGIFGYIIGRWFFGEFGAQLINFYELHEEFARVATFFQQSTFWTVFISAVTPIPYKVFTITAGLFGANIFVFVIASILGRGLRFFLLGALVRYLGERYADRIFRHFNAIALLLGILIILYLIFLV